VKKKLLTPNPSANGTNPELKKRHNIQAKKCAIENPHSHAERTSDEKVAKPFFKIKYYDDSSFILKPYTQPLTVKVNKQDELTLKKLHIW